MKDPSALGVDGEVSSGRQRFLYKSPSLNMDFGGESDDLIGLFLQQQDLKVWGCIGGAFRVQGHGGISWGWDVLKYPEENRS